MMDDFEVLYDHDYTQHLRTRIAEQFPAGPRNATHASDLFFCLRKAWARIKMANEEGGQPPSDDYDDRINTWIGGIMFEHLVREGEWGKPMAYCDRCRAVNAMPSRPPDGREVANCPVCSTRWLVFTPDYIVDGIVHEAKQTRKSSKHGPASAPWWIDQLRTYHALLQKRGQQVPSYGRIVANWIMGDYAKPLKASIDAYQVVFQEPEKNLPLWVEELVRRKAVVEGVEMPPLNGMGEGDELAPQHPWECAVGVCPVGELINCELYGTYGKKKVTNDDGDA